MDFQLTADQVEFREATRKLCAGRLPIAAIREVGGFDRDMWSALADFGVFTLRESAGWAGAAIVFEELGRALVPGPLIWTHLAADGERIVGGVQRPSGEGVPAIVEHLRSIDTLIILDADGLWSVDPATLDATVAAPLDPLTPVGRVAGLPQGIRVGGPEEAAEWRLAGAVLAAAQLAGIAGGLTDLTVAYTSERRQFGRPVGSFQAIKHLLADMLVRSELARTQAYAAALHLDEGLPDAARAVSSAKVVAGRAAIANGRSSVQAHGGMGCTWEVDAHLYLKRAWVLDSVFGSSDDHADLIGGVL